MTRKLWLQSSSTQIMWRNRLRQFVKELQFLRHQKRIVSGWPSFLISSPFLLIGERSWPCSFFIRSGQWIRVYLPIIFQAKWFPQFLFIPIRWFIWYSSWLMYCLSVIYFMSDSFSCHSITFRFRYLHMLVLCGLLFDDRFISSLVI